MSIGGFSPSMPNLPHDTQVQERKADSDRRLAQSQGIGGSKESDAASEDRDADGRQAWRWTIRQPKPKPEDEENKAPDITGQAGSNLDLSG